MTTVDATRPILKVEDLRTGFATGSRKYDLLRGVSFEIAPGERVGIVGESGSGKSITALSIMRLLPGGIAIRGGVIDFQGEDITYMSQRRLRAMRGREIGMVFQDPMASLNPLLSIGRQVTEGMIEHLNLSAAESRRRAVSLLEQVKLADPERLMGSHPHELSGGMRQRISIAMALACRPSLLIADEPTTALDVTVQAKVISVLEELTESAATAVIFISHSLDLLADYCDRLLVMYAGRIVEAGPTRDLVVSPKHPYTADLIASAPDIEAPRVERFSAIAGQPPTVTERPEGCSYHPRCRFAFEKCRISEPDLAGTARRAACWLREEDEALHVETAGDCSA